MSGTFRELKEFQLNGWTIQPCPDERGFDLVHGDERYHHDYLQRAGAAAQASPRRGESRTAEMLREGRIDPVRIAAQWTEELKQDTSTEAVVRRLVVEALLVRIEHYEKHLPSWLHGTPEDVDHWLHSIGAIPEDKLLAFYQWVGKHAVREAVAVAVDNVQQDPAPPEHRYYVYEFFDLIDPDKDGGPFPSQLPKGHTFCNTRYHKHTHGGGRLPTCGIDEEE